MFGVCYAHGGRLASCRFSGLTGEGKFAHSYFYEGQGLKVCIFGETGALKVCLCGKRWHDGCLKCLDK